MRKKLGGYIISTDHDGRTHEEDTLMCHHCGAHVQIQPGSGKTRGYCRSCDGFICGKRQCVQSCTPMEKWMDEVERHYRRMTS